MLLGAYSIVRFSNNLNDQRINLGVVVWHPHDGFRMRFTPSLSKAQAIDPEAQVERVKRQLAAIKGELRQATSGGETLKRLSGQFREGVEVSAPYPARIFSLNETLDRLFGMLVTPAVQARRVDPQQEFASAFKEALDEALHRLQPEGAEVEEMGFRRVDGIQVDLGLRTAIGDKVAFWHALSLLVKSQPNAQLAKAKAAALEIRTIRDEFKEFAGARQAVAIQAPASSPDQTAPKFVKDAVAWLKHGADEVLVIPETGSIASLLEPSLRKLI